MSFLEWLELSGFGTFVRESPSILAYPTFSTLHTIGLSIVVGLSTVVAARIVGFAPTVRLAPLRKLYPVMWFGFAINLFSGSGLALAAATTTIPNPLFITKMSSVIGAIVILRVLQVRVFRNPQAGTGSVDGTSTVLAGVLLVLWVSAMIAGRMIAYGFLE